MTNIFWNDLIVSKIMDFVCNQYLFTNVNKTTNKYYFDKSKKTSKRFNSLSRLLDSEIGITHLDALKGGNLDVIKYIHTKRNFMQYGEIAIKMGDIDIIKWFINEKIPMGPWCMVESIRTGDIDIVKLCCADGFISPYSSNWINGSENFIPALVGDTFKQKISLCKNWKKIIGWQYLLLEAVNRGYFEICKYIYSIGISPMPYGITNETINCTEEMILWMKDHYFFMDPWGFSEACKCRDVYFIGWLIENEYEIDPDDDHMESAIENAKTNDDPNVVDWVLEMRFNKYGF